MYIIERQSATGRSTRATSRGRSDVTRATSGSYARTSTWSGRSWAWPSLATGSSCAMPSRSTGGCSLCTWTRLLMWVYRPFEGFVKKRWRHEAATVLNDVNRTFDKVSLPFPRRTLERDKGRFRHAWALSVATGRCGGCGASSAKQTATPMTTLHQSHHLCLNVSLSKVSIEDGNDQQNVSWHLPTYFWSNSVDRNHQLCT